MYRIGHGIDIHQLVRGRQLILGGVNIPHEFGLEGHSDADVITHATIDAVLGAAGLPDIGVYFPNSDERWKGADSLKLLAIVWEEVGKSFELCNIDIAVLLEEPKLRPHISSMKTNIARVITCESSQINIKATTAETLGFVGRGEGIYCSAVSLLRLK